LRRLTRYLNIGIAILLAAAAAGVWWYGWRPLPRTSGKIRAPISAPARIVRDRLGVPHISAASEEDALFLHGYATAQDRLWQMDLLRRLAAGELAEIFGPAVLASDREARLLRMRRIAEQAYTTTPAADRAALAAYARGVNHFLESHRERLPVEFALLGYELRAWSVVDSILIGLHMFRTLTTSWRDEVAKRSLLVGARTDAAKVNFLLPSRTGSELQPGSNAWALSGAHTASGKPLVACDMHLEYTIPGIWHMAHLKAPGLNAAGVSLPGAPGVIVGHNERIAWGVTNLGFDVQDLYLEDFNERTGRYRYRGRTEQARLEHELIRVRGARPVELGVWVTGHGPILVSEGGRHMALRWTAAEPASFQYPFLELDRARDWAGFRRALERFAGPAQNFVYADAGGNVGYQTAGRLPIRKNHKGDLPVDGASGDYEWEGFIPFDQLPSAWNPASGLIVTANQNPFPEDYRYPVHGNFAPHYRSQQIRDLLARRRDWRPEDMLAIQKDVYSGFSHFLAGALAGAQAKRETPALAEAAAILSAWNGQMEKDEAEPLIAALAFQHLRRAIAERAAPAKGAAYSTQMAPAVIERILRERPAAWFEDYDALLLGALADAVEEGKRLQGRDLKRWKYGDSLRVEIHHPVGRSLPLVGRWLGIGPARMSGASTAVKQTTDRMGPSMRMVADTGDWEGSLLNLPIGESGHPLSRHYKDQWEAYYQGTSFRMEFGEVGRAEPPDAAAVRRAAPRLLVTPEESPAGGEGLALPGPRRGGLRQRPGPGRSYASPNIARYFSGNRTGFISRLQKT